MDDDKEKTDNTPASAVEDTMREEETAEAKQEGTEDPQGADESKNISETDRLLGEIEAEKERNVRLLADFDNFRRRTAREKSETYERAKESLIEDLLPVIDNFSLAMASAPEANPFADGMRMVHGQFMDFLSRQGVSAIEAVGTKFDPAMHDAIAYQPSDDVAEGDILFEAKRGYKMGERVMRPASVIVSSGSPADEAGRNDEAPQGTEA